MKDLTERPFAALPFTLPSLREIYRDGARPRAIIDEFLARLAEIDDPGIFIHLASEEDLRRAADDLGAFDPARALWGVPFAVKDNIDVAGMPTTAACEAYRYMPDRDAFVVARLRAAGAIPVGKTNLDQFATGLVGVRSPFAPPRNALDPAIVPGGSSSGSGVIIGHGALPFALGTDTAGSGRVPAALNNIVGLKPSLGALSTSGVVPACRTLDTVSIFAASVEDAHAAFRVAAGFDAADGYARPVRTGPLPAPLPQPRIAIPDAASLRFFGDEAQAAYFASACDALSARNAQITEIDFTPFYEVAQMLYDGAWVAERFAVIEPLFRKDPEAIHPVTRAIVAKADSMSATDAFRGLYRLADLKRACAPLIAAHEMLCVPTIPRFYTVDDLSADPVTPNSNLGTYTNFVNLLDLCALAVPVGRRSDGRPGSITLIGPSGADGLLAAEAIRLQAGPDAMGIAKPAPAPDEIALAVCGAHMSGLPLNGELVSRGGRFLQATETSADYRLYALPGGPPERPGLIRSGNGASIALEIWALPRPSVGDLLAGIPSPLGLGQIQLDNGTNVAGFLCEAIAAQGAKDITAFGGWRRYLSGGS
ncbi:MAG: allophanate hydrolase [Pseudomonadota bacterium]